jgi:NAD(P)-dependent dehydrogenase (short-subunit alcohol dehydrogenase family)
MTEIAGKAAVVTGGGSGIGRALARALAAEGASVVVADILEDRAEEVASEIADAGGSARAVACDVSDRDSVRQMRTRANEAFGVVSLLFANAGVTSVERLTELSDDDFDWITQVNFGGIANCVRTFIPEMIDQQSGHVVATASAVGLAPVHLPYHVPYTAAKAGVIGMMLNLRTELSEVGVGCTVVCPGGVATRIGETPRYRPERFGGPFEGSTVKALGNFRQREKIEFRPPERVAEMVLIAVRENRPMVVTDPKFRDRFTHEYVDTVMEAFDDVETFDRRR